MLKFEIFEKFDENCFKIFDTLNHSSNYNFFQSYDYLKKISLENKSKIKIIAISKNEKLIAILPLEIKKYFFFKVLQWIGTHRSDFCNPILIKNFDDFVDKKNFKLLWNDILESIGDYDLIFLNNQIEKIGESFNPFTQHLESVKFSKIYQIILPDDFKEYLEDQKNKDKKKYYEIHRTLLKAEKLKKNFNVSFHVEKFPENRVNFREIIKNKIKQLNSKKIRNNLDENFIKLFDYLIKNNNSKFLLIDLNVENKNISSCFGILLNDVFYYYIPMIVSNDYNNYKPGKILILNIIDWCIKNKVKIFDFGLGDEKYKENFSNQSLTLYRFTKHKSFLGKILLIGIKTIFFYKIF